MKLYLTASLIGISALIEPELLVEVEADAVIPDPLD